MGIMNVYTLCFCSESDTLLLSYTYEQRGDLCKCIFTYIQIGYIYTLIQSKKGGPLVVKCVFTKNNTEV